MDGWNGQTLTVKCVLHRYLNVSQVLQLGGVNENMSYEYPQLQQKHFNGCLRNLVVDSKVRHKSLQLCPKHPNKKIVYLNNSILALNIAVVFILSHLGLFG